jgi:hypothetical protein
MFLECGDFAITFTFAACKQRCYTNTSLTNDAKILAQSWEIEDNRVAVTGIDHK